MKANNPDNKKRKKRKTSTGNVGGDPKQTKIILDWDQVESLAKIQCTVFQICSYMNISEDTFARRIKEDKGQGAAEYLDKLRAKGIVGLKHRMFDKSLKDGGRYLMKLFDYHVIQKEMIEQLGEITIEEKKAIILELLANKDADISQ